MRFFATFSGLLAVVLLTMMAGTGFAANEDPLSCVCVPVEDLKSLSEAESACELLALETLKYNRWRLRPPQKGEAFKEVFLNSCNASINGTVVCQGGTLEDLAEPHVCAGAPAMP
jgi:hypothetical protein